MLAIDGRLSHFFRSFFFNDTATTEIYTLSLHDALPICCQFTTCCRGLSRGTWRPMACGDRKSTRLNSSHLVISYAVFCLKTKTEDRLTDSTSGAPATSPWASCEVSS